MSGLASGAQGGVAFSTLNRLLTLGPIRQRVVPDTANSFYLVARNDRNTAFAHHFIRNSGGSDAGDTGGSWPAWRYCGTAELASFDTAPTDAGRFIYSDDIGAQDYALQVQATGIFAGSYHGGDALNSASVRLDGVAIDPTQEASGSQLVVTHSATVTSGSAAYTIDFTVTVRSADGTLAFHCAAVSSSSQFSKVFIGMTIATGVYDEAVMTLQGGSANIPVPIAVGTTYLATARRVAMRNSGNGRVIRVTTNMTQSGTFRRAKIVRSSTRAKLYFEGVTGTLGAKVNLLWNVRFETGLSGQTPFSANLLNNSDFTSDLSGWTVTHTGGGVAWNAGAARFTRSASADSRMIQPVTTVIGGVYLMSGNELSTPGSAQGMASMALTGNINGSLSSPVPAYPTVSNETGYNAHVVLPTQGTSYVMAIQAAGTAGQTSDFDIMGFVKLADSI